MECRRGIAMIILSVRLSVCLSNAYIVTNGRKICPNFYTIRKIITLVFREEEWRVGATPSTWNFESTGPRQSEIADFEPIFAGSTSAVTPSESSVNNNRKSTTRFPMCLIWSSYIASKPPKGLKGAQKRETAVFSVKSHFAWRKSATKFLCVKNVSDKVVRHSLA